MAKNSWQVSQVMNEFLFLCFVCFALLSKKKKVELQSEVQASTPRLVFGEPVNSWAVEAVYVLLHFIAKPPEKVVTWAPAPMTLQALGTLQSLTAMHATTESPSQWWAGSPTSAKLPNQVCSQTKQMLRLYTDSPDIPLSQKVACQINCLPF